MDPDLRRDDTLCAERSKSHSRLRDVKFNSSPPIRGARRFARRGQWRPVDAARAHHSLLDTVTMRRTLLLSSLYVFALTLLALPYSFA